MTEMVVPSFLQNRSFDKVLTEMIGMLPPDIDTSEGSHPYNLIAPTAYEVAQMAEFVLVEAIKLIFPEFCGDYDEYVDYHAETCGMKRKTAAHAEGEIIVTGKAGTKIDKGTKFSTVSINGNPVVEFETTEEAVIGDDGNATITIRAIESGRVGNVSAGTIILMSTPLNNVNSVVNAEATRHGIDEESSEALIERIVEYEASQGSSFVGNPADYKRWALEVNGVGSAQIVDAQDGSGLVTIIIFDQNGDPAKTGDDLCEAVYNHIMTPDDPDMRLAPCGAKLSVIGPETIELTVSAMITIDKDVANLDDIKSAFYKSLKLYLPKAAEEGMIVCTKVGSLLSQVAGVDDYINFTINGGAVNIPIQTAIVPQIHLENISFVEVI